MNDYDEKYVCRNCIGEGYLKSLMDADEPCNYCGSDNEKSIAISNLAKYVEGAFKNHYSPTLDEPTMWEQIMMSDKESEYNWERSGDLITEIIQWEARVDASIAADLRDCLDEPPRRHDEYFLEREFDEKIRYEKKLSGRSHWHQQWRDLEHELKTQTRFFCQSARELFKSVFDDIGSHATQDGRPIFKKLQPGFELYRARAFQDDIRLKKALEEPASLLGPPEINAAPGRMNAHGISVFYGATDPQMALAEVRPPVGSKVVISKFILEREIKLLDLAALKFITVQGSVFDRRYTRKVLHAEFLKTFSSKITVPVMPDFQTSEYLITQAIADYLAGSEELKLDGIIYPSAQIADSDGVNIVLFHKSAKATGTSDTTFNASLTEREEDGEHTSYSIEPTEKSTSKDSESFYEKRKQMLRLDENCLEVHHVEAVSFQTEKYHVRRGSKLPTLRA